MSRKFLKGKNAVITGARQGIGRAILEKFAENGADIWACSHNKTEEFETDMAETAAKYGVEIIPVYFDLTNDKEIQKGVKEILSVKKEINVLVNNAGITCRALFQMTPVQKARDVFEVDFFAPYLITQILSKKMLRNKNGASIINIASTAGIDANSGRAAYGSAKAALVCLTRVIAEELGSKGVRANAIAPGIVNTGMLTYDEKMLDELLEESLLKKIGEPEDVADTALFLASDRAAFITGQVIRVDGGLLL